MAPLGPGTVQTLHHRAEATTRAAVIQPSRPPPAAPLGAPRNRPCQVDRVLPSHNAKGRLRAGSCGGSQVSVPTALGPRRRLPLGWTFAGAALGSHEPPL